MTKKVEELIYQIKPGTLWRSKAVWYYADFLVRKDEVVLIIKAQIRDVFGESPSAGTPAKIEKWVSVSFIGSEKPRSITTQWSNWKSMFIKIQT